MDITNLKNLKEKIDKIEQLKSQIKNKKSEYEESVKTLIDESKLTETEIANLKSIIETEALAEYKETKQKKLLGGIGIKVNNVIEYNETQAFTWAKEHSLCLQLDKKAFEALAKTQELDFVTKTTEDTVTFPATIKLED